MNHLTLDLNEVDDGVASLEGSRSAMASTRVEQHAAVMAEVRQVLDWAWRQFPGTHGPINDGMDWHHDLQVTVETGGWDTVTLRSLAAVASWTRSSRPSGAPRADQPISMAAPIQD